MVMPDDPTTELARPRRWADLDVWVWCGCALRGDQEPPVTGSTKAMLASPSHETFAQFGGVTRHPAVTSYPLM